MMKTRPVSLAFLVAAFLAGAGKSPADGLEIDPEDFEGESYIITVAEATQGGTRVESFIRESAAEDDAGQTPQAAAPAAPADDGVPFSLDGLTDEAEALTKTPGNAF